jgi:type II secretory ATPase GspE/PulE/Tfp pilus assembly ATPase PilB-like protein
MNAKPEEVPVVLWPPPPFHQFAAKPPGSLCACTIEMFDGAVLSGLLVEFRPGAESVSLWPDDAAGPRTIAIGRVRCVRLKAATAYAADAAALDGIGAGRDGRQRSFAVTFRDGTAMTGSTQGFIKEAAGLFLYVIDKDPALVRNCFIPAAAMKNVQIGAPLGETLVEHKAVDARILTAALSRQVKQRQDRIGHYLADRAIVSPEDLTAALHAQAKRPNARLGDILIEAGVITAEQLDQALAIQSQHRARRIGDILIDLGAVSARVIQVALSDKLGIPYVNAREFPIAPAVLEVIDTAFAIRHQVLPLLQTADKLIVAVENPLAADFLQDLRFKVSLSVDPVIADPQEIKDRIAKEYSMLESRSAAADSRGAAQDGGGYQSDVADLTSMLAREAKTSNRPVRDPVNDQRVAENTLVRLVNKIIIEAYAQGASDIHIESSAGGAQTRIRFRKDGELEDYLDLPQAYSNALVSRIKIMAELDISERRHPQDGKIDFAKHGPLAIELRVAIIPTTNNLEDVVLRILAGAEALPLDQVGFTDKDLASVKKMLSRSFGLILVCGPTGSGKTTTLHSLLRDINRPELKIWTAEDPVEITQRGLRQVQVNSKIDWTFAAAMRAFLRADPDVIMVGEMRDAETTKIAIEASLTGHLVLSTLHTNSAAESIVRLLDMGMDCFNFADALIGVLSQRLARKLCPTCKQIRVATPAEAAVLVDEYCADTALDRADVLRRWQREHFKDGHLLLREAAGCSACKLGYKGRVVVYELLAATPEIKHLVRAKAPVPKVAALALQEGMISLRQNAIDHVLRGDLDLANARAVSS